MTNFPTSSRQGFHLDWLGEELQGAVAKAAKDAINETLDEAVDLSKQFAPVKTGFLRSHIKKGPVRIAYNRIEASFGTFNEVLYDIFVELGTRRMAAQPHHRPAADRAFPKLAQRLARSFARYATKY